jgi:anti-repressor protein
LNDLITINFNEKYEQLVVSSREIAKNFEKRHADVTKAVQDLINKGGTENAAYLYNQFICSEYKDNQNGQYYPEYLLTRDGFSLLVMGFTGQKALEWKLKYVEAFNLMEKELNSPEKVMARALKIADQQINSLRLENSKLSTHVAIMQPKADYFDELVDRNLLTSFRDTSKELKVKEKDFIDFLLNKRFIYRDGKGKLMPYADKNKGLFEVKECFNNRTNWTGTQTMITPKGRETFRLLLI